MSALQSRGFATQESYKSLIPRHSALKLAPFGPGSISARLAACLAAHASISTDYQFTSSSAGTIGGACFFDDQDRLAYLGWLREALERERCSLHAYVLMSNHFHLLLTPEQAERVPQVLLSVGRRYLQYINRTYGRTGTL